MKVDGYMGSIEFDGTTVTVTKKARGSVRFAASSMASALVVPAGLGMKGIKFTVSGGVGASEVKAFGSHKDIARDPYGLTFRTKHLPAFENLLQHIEYGKANPGYQV